MTTTTPTKTYDDNDNVYNNNDDNRDDDNDNDDNHDDDNDNDDNHYNDNPDYQQGHIGKLSVRLVTIQHYGANALTGMWVILNVVSLCGAR
jgi:hypothetical protein